MGTRGRGPPTSSRKKGSSKMDRGGGHTYDSTVTPLRGETRLNGETNTLGTGEWGVVE